MASPLFEEWNRFIASPLSGSMINILYTNLARWELIMVQEERQGARGGMAESIASHASSSSSSSSGAAATGVGGSSSAAGIRRESLEPPPYQHPHHSRSSGQPIFVY